MQTVVQATWNAITTIVGDIQDDEFLQNTQSTQTIFNADPAAFSEAEVCDSAKASVCDVLEHVASGHEEPFVKHVSAMASSVMRPLAKAIGTRKATVAVAATMARVPDKCSNAKAS